MVESKSRLNVVFCVNDQRTDCHSNAVAKELKAVGYYRSIPR